MSHETDLSQVVSSAIRSAQRMNLKNQLRLYLKQREMTAAQLARKAGLSKQLISRWLAGQKPKDVDQVKKAAEALGDVSLDHLLFGDGIDPGSKAHADLGALLGDEWIGGVFEIRLRRHKV